MNNNYRVPHVILANLLVMVVWFFPLNSWAVNPALWNFSVATTGQDVFWTSPTAVDLGFSHYAATVEFTRLEVFTFLGGTDLTDQLPETTGTTIIDSLPVSLINEPLTEPTTGTAATVDIGIDANGFGQVSLSDVTLGAFLFLQITRVEIDANFTVSGVVPGDFDVDLDVDSIDLGIWESSYGVNGNADTDFDGDSDGPDFLDWQRFFGGDFSSNSTAVASVPEPETMFLALGLWSLVACSSLAPWFRKRAYRPSLS